MMNVNAFTKKINFLVSHLNKYILLTVFRHKRFAHNCWPIANRIDALNRRLVEHGLDRFFDESAPISLTMWSRPVTYKSVIKPFDIGEIVHAVAVLLAGYTAASVVFLGELLCKRFGWNRKRDLDLVRTLVVRLQSIYRNLRYWRPR